MKAYLSYLRIICCLSVILIHVSAKYVGSFSFIPDGDWQIANFIDSILRFSIPGFLMLSGAAFLNKDEDLHIYLKKRVLRIIPPLIFWATFYFIFNYYSKFDNISLIEIAKKLFMYIYQGASTTHLWYIYMTIPIYLFIPIIRKWTNNASKNELIYFLIIWGINLFINKHTAKYFPSIDLSYFGTYLGYLILGHFLDKHIVFKNKYEKLVPIFLFVIGAGFTYFITSYLSIKYNTLIRNFYWASTPNVALAAIGIFLFIKSFTTLKQTRLLNELQKVSFGIYLVHIFVQVKISPYINLYSKGDKLSLLLQIITLSLIIYGVSFIIIYLLKKIPIIKNWVG